MQSGHMMQLQHAAPQIIHSAAKPLENHSEESSILQSAMVTPGVRQITHENNILRTGMPERHHAPELISASSHASMKAVGPSPKTPMPIGHVRFAGAKKA